MTTIRCMALLAIVATASAVWQYRVNTQLNTELYGRGVGSVQRSNVPFHTASLRSDVRHDMFLSGALRSDVRGQYRSVGPLAPSGAASYIPSTARPYGTLGSPSGVAQSGGYSRAWQPRSSVSQPLSISGAPGATGGGFGLNPTSTLGTTAGSIRYVPQAARPSTAPLPGISSTTGAQSSLATGSVGSIRYGR